MGVRVPPKDRFQPAKEGNAYMIAFVEGIPWNKTYVRYSNLHRKDVSNPGIIAGLVVP